MSYNKRGWSPTTPLSVANLTAMDEGIYQNSLAVEAAKVQEITSFNAATDPTKLYSVTSDDNNYFVIVTRSETKITQFRFKNRTDISTPNIEIRNGSIDGGNIIWAGSWAKLIDVPSKTSDLINDSGFLTAHQDISGKADKATSLSGYGITDAYTKAEVNQFVLGIPTKTSQLTNDSGFLTAHQDISGKVDKTQTIAGLALNGNIGSAALAEAMAGNINPVGVVPGTTTGYGAQFGRSSAGKPVMHTLSKDWEELALASDVSGKQDKQTSVPTVGTTEEQGRWVVDTTDSVFRGLSIGQLFKAEIGEVYHTFQKTSESAYLKISDILHDGDIPTNVSAFTNDAGYLTQHQDVSGKMDLINPTSVSSDHSVKKGQIAVVSNEIILKTANIGESGHKTLAEKSTTLAGYGITDAFTKTEINNMIGDIESLLAEV